MEATSTEYTTAGAEDAELKRLCAVFAVSQSNRLYRLLKAKNFAEATAQILREERIRLEGRGGDKCQEGTILNQATGKCEPEP